MSSTTGIEYEFALIDEQGYLANRAKEIIEDPLNDGSIVDESNHARVEVNSDPANTVKELHRGILPKLNLLEEICDKHDISVSTVSELGGGESQQRHDKEKWSLYIPIIGQEANDLKRRISGIHGHFSQSPNHLLEQMWLFTALDPLSYATTSTSPMLNGINEGVNCHRINATRNQMFMDYPLHAQLQPYVQSIEEINIRDNIRFNQWLNAPGTDRETFKELFKPESTGYHPIRKRDSIGETGTWEIRSFDTTPLDISLGMIALYKGCNDRITKEDIPVRISGTDGVYSFDNKEVVLPNYTTLKALETEAIKYGLMSNNVAQYLSDTLKFSSEGLPEEDLPYLTPIFGMIQTRMNPSNKIMEHLKEKGPYPNPEKAAAQGQLFMRQEYLKSLDYQPHKQQSYLEQCVGC